MKYSMCSDGINEKYLLRYGEILTNDEYPKYEGREYEQYYRIRTIAYNNHIYYHKMVNGEVVEVKELKT